MHKMIEQWVNGQAVESPTQGEALGITAVLLEHASDEDRDLLLEAVGRLVIEDAQRGQR